MRPDVKNPLAKYTGKTLAHKAGAALDPTSALREITDTFFDYLKIQQQEQTRRKQIDAEERKAIALIDSQREIICQTLDRSFDERAKIFEWLLQRLDQALTMGDTAAMAMLTTTLTQIATVNPLDHIFDTANNLGDPNNIITLGTPPPSNGSP